MEGRTQNAFWVLMRWSFNILFTGVWPHADWNDVSYHPNSPDGRRAGHPLVGSDRTMFHFCVLWRIKGDLDFYQKERSNGHSWEPICL